MKVGVVGAVLSVGCGWRVGVAGFCLVWLVLVCFSVVPDGLVLAGGGCVEGGDPD